MLEKSSVGNNKYCSQHVKRDTLAWYAVRQHGITEVPDRSFIWYRPLDWIKRKREERSEGLDYRRE